jgi:hypothetical protein
MSKTFSGNSFNFRTPSNSTTKFHFDDHELDLVTSTVKMNTIQCTTIQDRNGTNKFSFNGNNCDLHGMNLINGNFSSETTEYITPLYFTGSGLIELTTNGNIYNGSNRFSTSINTIGNIRFKLFIKKADMSRFGIYYGEFSYSNVNQILSLSTCNLAVTKLTGDPFIISFTVNTNDIIVKVNTNSDTCLSKIFLEEFSL